ncbi:MAG: glycosyltransferase family 2 protein [Cyclobacteriaceae bacterium]
MRRVPTVSVIMTVYNTEKYLAQAVNSILNQTYQDFEFIIIDDGSSDTSAEILDSFSDPRLIVVKSRENKGLIAQSNRALGMARGKYIARMDSDDISLPQRLASQVDYLERHNQIGLCGTYLNYFDEHRNYSTSILPKTHESIGAFFLFGSPIVHSTIMFRKSVVDLHNICYPTDVRAGGDIAFLSMLYEYTRFANIPEVLFRCRIRSSSVSRVHNTVQAGIGYKVKQKMLEKIFPAADSTYIATQLEKHLAILRQPILNKSDLQTLLEWLSFLFQEKPSEVFDLGGYQEASGHFLYRQLVRDKACNITNLIHILGRHPQYMTKWPAKFHLIYLLRSLASNYKRRKTSMD